MPYQAIRARPNRPGPACFDYLRVSITGRCQLSCVYCRPEKQSREGHGLPLDTLVELCRALCAVTPIRKIRLTGGEPLLRPDLPDLVAALKTLPSQPEVALTTNGLLLEQRATELKLAGLDRINVSLISPDPVKYSRLTGGAAVEQVLRGLAAARGVGFCNTKINTVLTRHLDTGQVRGLLAVAAENHAVLRFIELMPLGVPRESYRRLFLPASAAREMLREVADVTGPLPEESAGAGHPRYVAEFEGGQIVTVEMIMPVSQPFCGGCRRLRVSRNGCLLPCLLSPVRLPLVGVNGTVPEPGELRSLLDRASALKGRAGLEVPERMWAIGG
ncbi:MAG: radical SAM protein [Armatimonadetes bacterium]|nr:radical SAM protein [Armatimonadota bacterium]